jgi:hypothetical protein
MKESSAGLSDARNRKARTQKPRKRGISGEREELAERTRKKGTCQSSKT